ncbi:hypothetical protein E2C01_060300 [Portunus trituberculatus]|uniref:Uncharacterized protein n=1 Tax=Portunus trituberculatus TaxID=210409 RepID=A0A5B7H931_PORTR|nr:hypothetical protein [Portunus trituberculatus]
MLASFSSCLSPSTSRLPQGTQSPRSPQSPRPSLLYRRGNVMVGILSPPRYLREPCVYPTDPTDRHRTRETYGRFILPHPVPRPSFPAALPYSG